MREEDRRMDGGVREVWKDGVREGGYERRERAGRIGGGV